MTGNEPDKESLAQKAGNSQTPEAQSGQGDIGVFDAFITNLASLKYFLSRFMITKHDIDDISQEAFLRAYQEERKRKIDQPKAFLFRIARNIVLSDFNRMSRKITDYIEDCDQEDILCTENLEDSVINQQKLGIYCEAVATLPAQCRRVVLMRKIYGMSYKEISKRLGISISTIEKHLAKGVKKTESIVRERYDERMDDIERAATTGIAGGKD